MSAEFTSTQIECQIPDYRPNWLIGIIGYISALTNCEISPMKYVAIILKNSNFIKLARNKFLFENLCLYDREANCDLFRLIIDVRNDCLIIV